MRMRHKQLFHIILFQSLHSLVKKTPIKDYAFVRKTGLAAITLREEDELIEVKFTDNTKDILLVTKFGQCIRFHETDVRSTGRTSMGVIGISWQLSAKIFLSFKYFISY